MKAGELTEWRERQGLTQTELAKILDVHTQTVNRWENKAREIPPFLHLALETIERNKIAPKKKVK